MVLSFNNIDIGGMGMKRFVTFLISFFVIITLCACSANGEAKLSLIHI